MKVNVNNGSVMWVFIIDRLPLRLNTPIPFYLFPPTHPHASGTCAVVFSPPLHGAFMRGRAPIYLKGQTWVGTHVLWEVGKWVEVDKTALLKQSDNN
jgi:hypothetical protein